MNENMERLKEQYQELESNAKTNIGNYAAVKQDLEAIRSREKQLKEQLSHKNTLLEESQEKLLRATSRLTDVQEVTNSQNTSLLRLKDQLNQLQKTNEALYK